MYKRLRIYYVYTALPFLMLLIGAVMFRTPILRTISANPHPQINYLIFAIILTGGTLVLLSVNKLMYEGQKLSEFVEARRSGIEPGRPAGNGAELRCRHRLCDAHGGRLQWPHHLAPGTDRPGK